MSFDYVHIFIEAAKKSEKIHFSQNKMPILSIEINLSNDRFDVID